MSKCVYPNTRSTVDDSDRSRRVAERWAPGYTSVMTSLQHRLSGCTDVREQRAVLEEETRRRAQMHTPGFRLITRTTPPSSPGNRRSERVMDNDNEEGSSDSDSD